MLRSFYCLLLLLSSLANNAQDTVSLPPLIPVPVKMQPGAGNYIFPQQMKISIPANNNSVAFVANHIAAKLKTAAGISAEIASQPSADIVLSLNKKEDKTLGKEGYQLVVNQNGIQIKANAAAGIFYGAQSLYQLLPAEIESREMVPGIKWSVPFVTISDQPRFGWRGLMLDVARHFFTKQQVKDFIDNMVRYKYNMLHLHLTDDQGWRLEIKSLPRLTEVGAFRAERTGRWGEFKPQEPGEPSNYGGFYTQDDIRELITYASERFVTIVPEIDIPGHSLALVAAYPELSCTPGTYQVSVGNRFMIWPGNGTFYGTIDNNLCPANEQVYTILDKIFTEVAALFPYEYIHMGGDETYKGFWEKSDAVAALMKKEKLQNMHEVQSYFVKRVSKIIASKGKKMIGWDEILEGGVAPGSAVMSWRGEKGGIEAAALKHPVVMTPSTYVYVDLYQGDPLAEPPTYSMLRLSKTYNFNPVPPGVDSSYILGGQANLWSERLHTVRHAEYMLWPRGWAVAESVWSPVSKKNWADFIVRAEAHFKRYDIAGINYSRSMYDPILDVQKVKDSTIQVALTTEVPGLDIHYSFDEFYPDQYYPVYSQPLLFPPGASSLKVQTYRKGKPAGKPINLPLSELKKRVKL
ncbi:beta-N-acetylhexosaminidase [Flavihumibacter profundi]|uniref:beta-N-acetylhexosaminidase n=1 Tax=Flavihumibacter profundi TaxID=2716883 RepID=UPI001CC7F44C|nr:family 20 glycosylhydrolase [Flavihumibacter profundi]MBZ5856466.1 family 20 glycosylhydrolase [Flavihumibacter profundi]